MIDVRILREDPDGVRERLAARGGDIDWEAVLAADRQRRETLARWERLKEQKNKLSGEIGRIKKTGGDAASLMEEIGAVSKELDALDGPLSETERRFSESMLDIPNLPDPGVPVGES
ncbi:MAG: serine--tRNA ligase, partial [Deltaproteobacteria bacterium]|nr:serine--tRNA ligase [Deltaproteobacteria bacterium]